MQCLVLKHWFLSVRDITWLGVIKCALHQVEVGTCTSGLTKISKVYQISNFHEWHLAECQSLAHRQVIYFTVFGFETKNPKSESDVSFSPNLMNYYCLVSVAIITL